MDFWEIFGYIFEGSFILLGIIAAVRVAIKTWRGGRVDIPAVGYLKDLPSSVTGINKHDDMSERSEERRNRRTE